MNKADLIKSISEKGDITRVDAEKALNAFVESVEEALVNGDKVQLVGFGSFEVRERAERKGRNPQTKKEITIKASKAPVFKVGKALKDMVNE
ncbi:MAG: HU family DNA-binding protein [Clostridiaceae bacterium]